MFKINPFYALEYHQQIRNYMTLTFDPMTQINRVPPLIIRNLHVKFESDWT